MSDQKSPKIIAVAGKGGVGKTSIAAVTVKILTKNFPDKKILAIDADPAVGLSTALGIEVKTTIDDIRKEVVSTVEDGDTKSALELLGEARYRIFDALVEANGFSFIAIGRPEASGCYCQINSYLKEVIGLVKDQFDYVVIDGEAGIEQVNRRVMEKVSHLFLVTDSSKKGCQVIQTIKNVADELVMYEKIGVIANRLPSENGTVPENIKSIMDTGNIPVLTYIPSDSSLAEFDLKGENVFFLPDESPIVNGVSEALRKVEII